MDGVLRVMFVVGVVVVVIALIWRPPASPVTVETPPPPPHAVHVPRASAQFASARVVVYVAGAVVRSGLYTLPADARVDDAVRAAGGLRSDADAGQVNLAQHVADGDEVFAPVVGASPPRTGRTARARRRGRAPKQHRAVAAVSVNVADAQTLATLPGIGPALAARIVAVRTSDGAFTSFDQLLDVAGMTASRLDKLRHYLTL